ncbi:hypothetical protein WG922_03465 [Ramlibacter sp. AN1015]|uniref:hypothetical protein n=1 Tax=Ramlibacter sp. AN1015 TaxID=3133428 RepID=UPI0030BFC484
MGFLDLILHLAGFLAPALALSLALPLAGRFLVMRGAAGPRLRVQFAVCLLVAAAAQFGGLWLFGRDGAMATYGALVLATASAQWLLAGGWRR